VKAARATTLPTAVALAVSVTAAPAAHSDEARAIDCAGDPGDPVPGTIEWDQVDVNNRQCAVEGLRVLRDNPGAEALAEAGCHEAGVSSTPRSRAARRNAIPTSLTASVCACSTPAASRASSSLRRSLTRSGEVSASSAPASVTCQTRSDPRPEAKATSPSRASSESTRCIHRRLAWEACSSRS
jgi:hypothetical protein